MLFHAESGDYEIAWRHLIRDNPLPAITGRVCHHSCVGYEFNYDYRKGCGVCVVECPSGSIDMRHEQV